jgi:hypothetical protein
MRNSRINKDPQAERVYAAELTLPVGFKFKTHQARRWARSVVASPTWKGYPGPPVVSVLSNGDRDYSEAIHPDVVMLANGEWNQQTLTHELAHLLADPEMAHHGTEFVNAYLTLIRDFWGAFYLDEWLAAFRHNKINHTFE